MTTQDPVDVPWSILLGMARGQGASTAIGGQGASTAIKGQGASTAMAVEEEDVVITGSHDGSQTRPLHLASGAENRVTSTASTPPSNSKGVSLPWKTTYFGFSAASICRGMGFAEVAHTFHRSRLCIRSFDCKTGNPKSLPQWATLMGKS